MQRGFTLIEMLVVMVILAILAATAYPSYAGHVVRTRRTEAQIALIEAIHQQERYRLQHNSYAEFSSEDAQGFRWWSAATAGASAYELDAHACTGQDIADCVVVRARPGTVKVDSRFRDPDCGALSLDSYGVHAAEGSGRCWP
ncbi:MULTISPECIES: type IV pilin protein [unclassified Massilia]|uniref:type IV pilin protein n=1 Tax=unclassified Massilia TaxID=2609279 RepID=UPI000A972ED3|nr:MULTISPECIES: type IV pilin protein [unclassified Massilia]